MMEPLWIHSKPGLYINNLPVNQETLLLDNNSCYQETIGIEGKAIWKGKVNYSIVAIST